MKVRDELFPGKMVYQTFIDGAVSQTSTYTSANILGRYQSVDGIENGRFVPGLLRINPVTMRKITCATSNTDSTIEREEWKNGKLYKYTLTGMTYYAMANLQPFKRSSWTASWDGNLERLSVSRAYAKLSQAENDVALFLAELNETIKMLRSPLASLRKSLTKLVNNPMAVRRNLRELAQGASGTWLEFRYGILPLISDIQMLLSLLNSKMERFGRSLRRRRATSRKHSQVTVEANTAAGTWSSVKLSVLKTVNIASTSVVYFRYNEQVLGYEKLRKYGFSPDQMLPLIWELTPYSFVVDWILNIGTWLQAIVPKPGIDILGCCTSQKTTTNHMTMGGNATNFGFTKVDGIRWQPTYSVTEEVLVRRLSTVPLVPSLQSEVLNLKRTFDSISLLWQNLPRRR